MVRSFRHVTSQQQLALKLTLLLLAAAAILPAQFVRGTILGNVTDDSGAVIPGAEITLKNLGTNETKIVTSDESGAYNFPALLPGRYSLQVKKTGFKLQSVSDVGLEVNQTARVDIKLPVGDVAETVEVTAGIVQLKTDTSEIGHVVSNKQIVDLPLNGRDYLQLARLAPGVVPSRAGATAGQKGVSRSINSVGSRHIGQLPPGWRGHKRRVIPNAVGDSVHRRDPGI